MGADGRRSRKDVIDSLIRGFVEGGMQLDAGVKKEAEEAWRQLAALDGDKSSSSSEDGCTEEDDEDEDEVAEATEKDCGGDSQLASDEEWEYYTDEEEVDDDSDQKEIHSAEEANFR